MTEALRARVRFVDMDPDFRRDPRTRFFCAACQKDMNPTKPYRVALLVDGESFPIHPDDRTLVQPEDGSLEEYPIGDDCARRIGSKWTETARTPASAP